MRILTSSSRSPTTRAPLLDERGLHRGRKVIARKAEQDIYEALGLPFIEPELREGQDEIALALKNGLPRLVTDADIRGIFHAHTDRSDGAVRLKLWQKRRASAAISILA